MQGWIIYTEVEGGYYKAFRADRNEYNLARSNGYLELWDPMGTRKVTPEYIAYAEHVEGIDSMGTIR